MKQLPSLLSFLCLTLAVPAPAAESNNWTVLFDGTSTQHWRGFKSEAFPAGGWSVENGLLVSIGSGDRIDLITKKTYTDFELELEWRVEPRGNSGIFYRVSEEAGVIWHAAPEYQIIDDGRVRNPLQSTAALYDLVPPNDQKTLRPVGEFNQSRIVSRGSRVEHWLNGVQVASFDFDDPVLKEKIAASKFGSHKEFAQAEAGHIGLQHHGDTVAFRNIRIRELSAATAD